MKEKSTIDPFTDLLRPDEEILWLGKSAPMSLIKPLMSALKICAILTLIVALVRFCSFLEDPNRDTSRNIQESVKIISDFLKVALPGILIIYGFYWWLTRYEPVAAYAVTNERVMMRMGRKTTAWKHDEIKKIDIVGDEDWASMTFTRVGGEMSTWHDIRESDTILEMIRARVKTPIFVDYIQG